MPCSRVVARNSKYFTFVCRHYSTSLGQDNVTIQSADVQRVKGILASVGASSIAQLIGANPHASVSQGMEQLWEKNHKKHYQEALKRNKLRISTPEETLKELGVL